MEDESQKMVALKKVYAEVILNTAKDAAARVMAAERKALRFQHDLSCTKDEAVRMLLRLKQMIDSKTSEAEIASLNQQRKIEELEAQLQEAEDIITDLRAELRQVWNELERANSNQVKPLDEQITREEPSFAKSPTPELILPYPSGSGRETVPPSGLKNIPLNSGIDYKCCDAEEQTEQSSVSDLDKFYAPDSDLPSIIMRTKEPELLRNGCTQRIRAFERNTIDQKLIHSGHVDNLNSHGKNDLVIKASDKEEVNCNPPSIRDKSMDVVDNPSVGDPAEFYVLQRRKTRLGKAGTSGPCHCSKLMTSRQAITVPSECIMPSVKTENVELRRTSSRLKKSLQHSGCSYMDVVKTIPRGKRTRRVKSTDGTSTSTTGRPSSILSRCRTLAYLGNAAVKSSEDRRNTTESKVHTKPLPRLDSGLMLIRSGVDCISGSADVTVSMKGILKSEVVETATEEDMELIDVPVLLMEENAVENTECPSAESDLCTDVSLMGSASKDVKVSLTKEVKVSLMNSELKDAKVSLMNSEFKDMKVSLMNSDLKDGKASLLYTELKDANASLSSSGLEDANASVVNSALQDVKTSKKSDGAPVLKYTFQRKRKNSLRNPGQSASVEENTAKRRMEAKECVGQHPQMTNGSSRESRRLAQVARQLISLGGKR